MPTSNIELLKDAISQPRDVISVSDIFKEIYLDPKVLHEKVREVLTILLSNPTRLPPSISKTSLDLSEGDANCYSLSVSLKNHIPATITSQPFFGLITTYNEPLSVEVFNLPRNWNPSVFDPTKAITRKSRRVLKPGEVLEIDGSRYVYDMQFIEGTLALQLISTPIEPFEWSFDRETLKPWQSVSTNKAETNLEHLCYGAMALDDPELCRGLSLLATHPRHFVRWAAIRTICFLDPGCAEEELRKAVADPHPHLADAAKRSLAALEARKNGSNYSV